MSLALAGRRLRVLVDFHTVKINAVGKVRRQPPAKVIVTLSGPDDKAFDLVTGGVVNLKVHVAGKIQIKPESDRIAARRARVNRDVFDAVFRNISYAALYRTVGKRNDPNALAGGNFKIAGRRITAQTVQPDRSPENVRMRRSFDKVKVEADRVGVRGDFYRGFVDREPVLIFGVDFDKKGRAL